MKHKSVKLNIILNIVKTFLSIVFPLITFPYVSRILQADSIGKVQFATSIVSYFLLLASLGISTYAIREGSFLKQDKNKLQEFCNQIFSFNLLTTMISYLFLFLLLLFMNKAVEYKYLIIIQSLTMIFTTLGVDWINSIFEEYLYITIRNVFIQIVTLILTFLLIKNTTDYYIYAIILVISSVGANILNYFYVKKYIKIHFTFHMNIKKHLKPILILFSSSLATTIYNSSDITMLGLICTDYIVGIYYIGTKIYSIAKQLLNSAIAVAIPRISYYISNFKELEKEELLNKLFYFIIIIILPFVTGMISLNQEIILLISGQEYIRASSSLFLLSFALLFAVLANFSSNLILITHKEETKSLISTITAAILNLVLNFIFIPLFQEQGAAFTTLLAECVAAIISTMYAKKYFKAIRNYKLIISSFFGCFFIYGYSKLIHMFHFGLFINIISIFLGSVMIYSIFMFFLNKKYFKNFLKK